MIDQIVENSKASINKEDLRKLLQLTLPLQPKNILEIGAWKGYSAEVWEKAFSPSNFISIEKETAESLEVSYPTGICYGFDSHNPDVFSFIKKTFTSVDLIDFLFIDGDHSFEGVKKDWKMYGPLVKKGGVVIFHDVCYVSNDPLAPVQVATLWNALKEKYPYVEIKSGPNSTGIGVLYV